MRLNKITLLRILSTTQRIWTVVCGAILIVIEVMSAPISIHEVARTLFDVFWPFALVFLAAYMFAVIAKKIVIARWSFIFFVVCTLLFLIDWSGWGRGLLESFVLAVVFVQGYLGLIILKKIDKSWPTQKWKA